MVLARSPPPWPSSRHHRRDWLGAPYSARARELLDHWETAREKFVKVFPLEYKRALGELNAARVAAEASGKAKAATKPARAAVAAAK